MTKRTEKYMGKENSNTVLLVVVLVMGVALIFICFAMVAICYRSSQCFVIVCVSASVIWVNQQFGRKILDNTRIWSPESRLVSKSGQIGDTQTCCLCLCALCWKNTTRLEEYVALVPSQDTSAVNNCSLMSCTKQTTKQ